MSRSWFRAGKRALHAHECLHSSVCVKVLCVSAVSPAVCVCVRHLHVQYIEVLAWVHQAEGTSWLMGGNS